MAVGLDKIEPGKITEEKHLVVEGMDISGHWNRMFEQRVIWDYDVDNLEKVKSLPDAESLGWCYGCAKCTAVAISGSAT